MGIPASRLEGPGWLVTGPLLTRLRHAARPKPGRPQSQTRYRSADIASVCVSRREGAVQAHSVMIGGIRQRRRDLAQLAHSMNWFGENHDASCSATPVIIHQAVIGTNNAPTPPATRG